METSREHEELKRLSSAMAAVKALGLNKQQSKLDISARLTRTMDRPCLALDFGFC